MINFVYGRMSDTRLEYITKSIANDHENGVRSFLIVPEQFSVHTERHMLCSLPASAQLTLEILNFSRLYNRVCREYGGLLYNYLTKPLKYAMMWQNLRELSPLLSVYGRFSSDTSTLCDMMLHATNEFKMSGVSPRELEKAADKLSGNPLSDKLRDLALISSSYDNLVSRAFSDSSDDISKLYEVLCEHEFFAGTNVYIDSFTSFTATEHKVIEKIFESANNVTVTLPLDAPRAETIYNKSVIDSETRLTKNAEKHGQINTFILDDTDKAQSTDIKSLAANLFTSASGEAEITDTSGAVQLIKCSSPYTEAEAAAATVLSLMREGKRCRDIVVIMRNAEQYKGIIEPAFERCGIPYHFSEKTDFSTTPIVKFIISALRIGIYNWRSADVISHLKCALYDIPTQELDLFEQYVTTWQIRGSGFTSGSFTMHPDGYVSEEPKGRSKNILDAANRVRETLCASLLSLFEEIDNSENTADKIRAIYRFISRSSAADRLKALSKKEASRNNTRAADELSRLYAYTCDSLASLLTALEADEGFCQDLSLSELCELLTVYFSKSDVGSIPSSADQVIIGSASMMRAGNPDCVLMLGMCEGVFPAPVSERGLLSFSEKDILANIDIKLSGTMDLVASDELMFVERSVSSAKEKLYMFSYANSTDGRKTSPSLPFIRAAKLFKNSVKNFDAKDILSTTPSLRASLQHLDNITDPETKAALIKCIKEDKELSRIIGEYRSPISDVLCSVSDETAASIFGNTLRLSQSRIDKFVNCNFSYYCTYVLKLREEQISRFKANDIGTFVHYILEKLLSKIVREDGIGTEFTVDELSEMTEQVVSEYIRAITPKGLPVTARLGHLYDRLYRLSLLLVCNIIEEFRHSTFRPEFFELRLDGKGENPSECEFILNDGQKIVFSGIIDRVDILKKDNEVYIRVVDYKTGTKQFSLGDIEHGLNIQMLLYLFSLIKNKNKAFNDRIGGTDTRAAGVVYLSSNIPTIDMSDLEDESTVFAAAEKKLSRSGIFLDDEEILTAMNDEISSAFLASGIKRKKDGTISGGDSLVSVEQLASIQKDIERVIKRIAGEMLSGQANAAPLNYNHNDPCKYCAMKPICRISDSAERR